MRQVEWQRVVVGCWLGALGVVLGSCSVDLGKCDMTMLGGGAIAGIPFTGQALINTRCADGRCHSALAKGAARVGVPAGLNFDAVVSDQTPDALTRVNNGIKNIHEYADKMWSLIDADQMPPKGAATALSSMEKDQIRNFLACNPMPVLAPQATVTTPDLDSLYLAFTQSTCTTCHNNNTNAGMGFSLGDNACMAYHAIVNAASVTPTCMATGMKLIVPGNPNASFMYQKLTQMTPPCGMAMPLGSPPLATSKPDVTNALLQWIMMGAPPPAGCQ